MRQAGPVAAGRQACRCLARVPSRSGIPNNKWFRLMKIDTRESLSGLLTLAFGGLVLVEASRYSMGNLLRMGPGFFPSILGWGLVGVGLLLLIQALRVRNVIEKIQVRPLICVTVGLVGFALMINSLGVFMATAFMVVVSRFAERGLNWKVTLLLAAALNLLVYLVFVLGLSIHLKLFPWS